MPLFSRQLLFLAAALLAASVAADDIAVYQPASGYYKCPATGMVCNVKGCNQEGDCSIIPKGFDVNLVDSTMVYTSNRDDAELSIVGTVDSSIACDISCDCQIIQTNTGGCSVPSEAVFGEGIMTSTGDEYDNIEVSEANTEESGVESTSAVSIAGSLLLSAVVALAAFSK